MDSASLYIPLDRRQALAQGRALPERSTGAALFADISGFTPLTETLTRTLGPQRAAEELTRQLDAVYTAIISEVDGYHGCVTSFSGDAITAWFDGDETLTTLRAVTAAFAMQRIMGQFAAMRLPNGDSLNLAMKAAIACGPTQRFVVGDPGRQLFDALTGATLDRLAATDGLAHKGEVALSPEAVERLGGAISILEWRIAEPGRQRCAILGALTTPAEPLPWPALPPGALSEAQIRPWILPAVYERLRQVQGGFLAELRQAVAIFLKFEGLDYDHDPAAGVKLDAFVRWVQNVVEHYEGTLLQVSIGDKGSYLYIAFGATLAHEDDAARGVAAARILSEPPTELNYIHSIQIGVSKGQMRVGPYGGASYRTYGLLGDDVNLSSRLMQAAGPGQIVVSERITTATRDDQDWVALPPLAVKGRAEPIQAYALGAAGRPGLRGRFRTRLRQTSILRLPMVGRQVEKAALVEVLKTLGRNESGVVILEGEAGIGKSRLLGSLLVEANTLGLTQMLGIGDAIETSTPYYAWRPVFSQLFQLDVLPDEAPQRRAHILATLPADLHERAPLLNSVLPLDWPESRLTDGMTDGQVRADNTRELLLDLLQGVAGQAPTLLVLEDAHWLDSASWALALAVSRRVRPLVLVIVTRPLGDAAPAEYLQLAGASTTKHQQLDLLTSEDTLALVRTRLGVAALPAVVSQLIQDKAEGHPFFSEELAYSLRDAGLIQVNVERGECQVTPGVDLTTIPFPDTVQDVITHRIDRLAPQQQLTLKAASVIGRVFPFRALHNIHPEAHDRPRLVEDLNTLARLELTPMESTEPELAYFFKHAITQEVAYNLMLFAQRRQLHRALAEWYETAYADNLSPYYAILSHHWRQAEDRPKSLEYLEKTGEVALGEGAYREAIKFLGEALGLEAGQMPASTPPSRRLTARTLRQAYWMAGLGEAYRALGQMSESRRFLEGAVARFDRPVPRGPGQLAAGLIGQLFLQTLHRLWPGRFIGRASTEERSRLLQAARRYRDLTAIFLLSSEQVLTLYVALRIINATERAGPSPELAVAYGIMGLLSGLVGLHPLAENYLRQGLSLAESLNQPAVIPQVLTASALYRAGMGQWTRAKEEISRALTIYLQFGNWRLWIDAIGILAVVEGSTGHIQASEKIYSGVYASRDRHGDLANVLGLSGQGNSLLTQGQTEKAIQFLEQALSFPNERTSETISTHGGLALAYLRKGDWAQAEQQAEHTARVIARNSPPSIFSVVLGYVAVAHVYLHFWESQINAPADYSDKARKACQALWAYTRTFPIGEPSAWRYQGWYEWLTQRPRPARQAWEKSLAAARKLGMPLEEANAYFELGRHAPDADRQANLNRALELYQQLGVTYEAGQIQALLSPPHG